MKNIYIAGPMSNVPKFNFPVFDGVAEALAMLGFDEVFNPAQHDRDKYGVDFSELCPSGDPKELARIYPAFDLKATLMDDVTFILTKATHICFLPGWEKSTGANIEHALAKAVKLEIIYVAGAEPDNARDLKILDAAPSAHVCRTVGPGDRCDICFAPLPVPDVLAGDAVTAAVTAAPQTPGSGAERLIDGSSDHRKHYALVSGLLDYFPDACADVAFGSFVGNEKHNPGEPMHHARGKSMDHADCAVRHLVQRGGWDTIIAKDGTAYKVRHSTWAAWRALANLQEEIEHDLGLPLPRAAKAA